MPEINRALARELYVDSTVNVVNPTSNSPPKIKPGQMNLFNPKGQKNLQVQLEGMQRSNSPQMTSGTERSVDKIASIYNDQGGNAKIRN